MPLMVETRVTSASRTRALSSALQRERRARILVVAAEQEDGVVTAESEAVAERDVELSRARCVRNVVEVAARIRVFVVDRRWSDVALDRENGDSCLDGSGGAEAVTDRAFDRRHRRRPRL